MYVLFWLTVKLHSIKGNENKPNREKKQETTDSEETIHGNMKKIKGERNTYRENYNERGKESSSKQN